MLTAQGEIGWGDSLSLSHKETQERSLGTPQRRRRRRTPQTPYTISHDKGQYRKVLRAQRVDWREDVLSAKVKENSWVESMKMWAESRPEEREHGLPR